MHEYTARHRGLQYLYRLLMQMIIATRTHSVYYVENFLLKCEQDNVYYSTITTTISQCNTSTLSCSKPESSLLCDVAIMLIFSCPPIAFMTIQYPRLHRANHHDAIYDTLTTARPQPSFHYQYVHFAQQTMEPSSISSLRYLEALLQSDPPPS